MNDTDSKVRKIKLSLPEAIEKIKNWCAYQERSHFETQNKLYEFGLNKEEIEQAIAVLITDNFLNEERFAETFTRGKYRIKHWGRNKIKAELKFKKVSDYSIKKALNQIDEKEYMQVLHKVIERKLSETKEKNELKKKYKVLQYAVSRGFESDLVNDVLKLKLGELSE